jgi:hypothetical protein
MVQPVSSDARLRWTSGVLPIRSMKVFFSMLGTCFGQMVRAAA